jgi:hypothetical protein
MTRTSSQIQCFRDSSSSAPVPFNRCLLLQLLLSLDGSLLDGSRQLDKALGVLLFFFNLLTPVSRLSRLPQLRSIGSFDLLLTM